MIPVLSKPPVIINAWKEKDMQSHSMSTVGKFSSVFWWAPGGHSDNSSIAIAVSLTLLAIEDQRIFRTFFLLYCSICCNYSGSVSSKLKSQKRPVTYPEDI